jgi:hypothetical protein
MCSIKGEALLKHHGEQGFVTLQARQNGFCFFAVSPVTIKRRILDGSKIKTFARLL